MRLDETDTLEHDREDVPAVDAPGASGPLMPWAQDAVPVGKKPGDPLDRARERRIELVVKGAPRRGSRRRRVGTVFVAGVLLLATAALLASGGSGGSRSASGSSRPVVRAEA